MAFEDARKYGDGTDSSVGTQLRTDYYYKKALIDIVKEQYFTQLADVRAMPKNMGKTIKQYHYIPLLDDRNVNDQGIDATGAVITDGNLYGSSKDVGTIAGKLPALSESGGRVNRVGYTRISLEGTIEKFGFFDEYTQESLDFDTDAELQTHISREALRGANEMTEDALQIDLLNGAGVVRFTGAATSDATTTAEGSTPSVVTYDDLMRLEIDLNNNRCPKDTTVIKGSRMIDTKTVGAARIIYAGSELQTTFEKMVDYHGDRAFIPVQKYADAGNTVNGEIGSIGRFRIVIVPEMMNWSGVGADVGTNPGYRATGGKYDVFPMLVVGSGSFTTIGFQTDGKTVKFKMFHKKPGEGIADRNDPYGETGFHSIKWYYGTMILRPEWMGLVKTVAPL